MNVCLSVCLSSMDSKTIHPIAVRIWEVVERTPGQVLSIIFFKYRPPGPSNSASNGVK